MLDFHVTFKIYDLFKAKKKAHEYRECSRYWISRLEGIELPVKATIWCGYTGRKMAVKVISIEIIRRNAIKEPLYRDFIRGPRCYDIEIEPLRRKRAE